MYGGKLSRPLRKFCKVLRTSPLLLSAALLICAGSRVSKSQVPEDPVSSTVDSDHDGLSDTLEQSLLVQFVPDFEIGREDCSGVPGEFVAGVNRPVLKAENGTIYGQVFPTKGLSENK
jgi:hypothetical protein